MAVFSQQEIQEAQKIAEEMKFRGFKDITFDDVLEFARTGSLPPSVVGEEYDSAREDALLDLLKEAP